MAIAFTNLGASVFGTTANPDTTNGADAASYSNTSWTPPTTGLILLAIYSAKATAADVVNTVTGNSLTWVNLKSVTYGTSNIKRLTLFGADATGATTGATTVDFNALVQIGCNMSFFQATGVDLSGGVAVGAGKAVIQAVSAINSTGTTGTVTLATATSANNRPISVWGTNANEALVPRASWTEMDSIGGTAPTRSLETQARSDAMETTATATWTTSGPWGGIAAELNAASAGGVTIKNLSALGVG